MKKKKWNVEKPRSWRDVSCCFIFVKFWKHCCKDFLPSDWISPLIILDLYLGTQGEGTHTVTCRLSFEHEVFSDTPQWALMKLTVHRCQPWSWWAMHCNVGPLTSQPIIYCSFTSLKGKERIASWLLIILLMWVGHCSTPNQTYCLYEEPGPSMNVSSNKVTCPNLYAWIENSKM